MKERAWDIYEVALLIEAYLKIENGANRISTLESLSVSLRKLAQNDGIIIDEKYRNLNGMQWQLSLMKLAFNEKTLENRKPSKLFSDVVSLYKNNNKEFQRILDEAKKKTEKGIKVMTTMDEKDRFLSWYELYQGKKCSVENFIDFFEKVSAYSQKYGISKVDFWDIKDYKFFNTIRVKLSGNRIFKFTHPKLFSFMEKWGKLFSIYLKENYFVQETSSIEKDELQKKGVSDCALIEQREYVYHDKFGFGKVTKHDEKTIEIDFDGIDEKKIIVIDHPTMGKITEEDYNSKRIPLNFIKNEEKNTVDIADKKVDNKEEKEGNIFYVDFNGCENYAFTSPQVVRYFAKERSALSWKEVYSITIAFLCEDYPDVFTRYIGRSLIGATRIDVATKKEQMVAPRYIGNGLFIETNLSATDIIKHIKLVLDLCLVDYENVVITYTKNNIVEDRKEELDSRLDDGAEFSKWLLKNQNMSVSSCRNYYSSLKSINEFAIKHGKITKSIFSISAREEMVETARLLLTDDLCAQYNSEQHNRFSAALKKYLTYRFGEDSIGLVAKKGRVTSTASEGEIQRNSPYLSGVSFLLEKYYKYGFRINSSIEIMKIRKYASNRIFDVQEYFNQNILIKMT